MNPQDSIQNSSQPPAYNPLSVMQPGEQVVCSIKRHPIGIFGIYIASGALLVILAVLAFIVTPSLAGSDQGQVTAIGAISFIVLAALILAFVFISNIVYWGNSWILTSDSLTQVTQTSLFHKQSAQLSLGSLEDVSAAQDGILAHMFNFGTLRVETAGERTKFIFLYCPNPNYYAQKVLSAREVFEQSHANHGSNLQPPEQAIPQSPPTQLEQQNHMYNSPPAHQPLVYPEDMPGLSQNQSQDAGQGYPDSLYPPENY